MKNRMKKTLAVVSVAVIASGVLARAQEPGQGGASGRQTASLKVQIVIARYQGDKKVSSVPYTLAVAANLGGRSSIRMGTDIAVPTTSIPKAGSGDQPITSIQYMSVGTNIDCTASMLDGGRFHLSINIEDSSVYTDKLAGTPNVTGVPAIRRFGASENVILRDGQTTEFTVATDKLTGEVVKADVTLTVVK